MAADFILDQLEEQPGTLWVQFTAKRPVGRTVEAYTLSVEFEESTLDEIDAISDNDDDVRDLLARKAIAWKGFKTVNEDGKPVELPFHRERFEGLLSRPWFLRAVSEAYQNRLASVEKRRSRQRGN